MILDTYTASDTPPVVCRLYSTLALACRPLCGQAKNPGGKHYTGHTTTHILSSKPRGRGIVSWADMEAVFFLGVRKNNQALVSTQAHHSKGPFMGQMDSKGQILDFSLLRSRLCFAGHSTEEAHMSQSSI